MFVQLMEKIESLEIAVTFNGDMVERMNKSFEEVKKENENLREEHEKMKAEVQQHRMDMSTLKEKAISSEISAEVRSRSYNIIMMSAQDETRETIPSSRPLRPFIVTFTDYKVKNLVLTNRKAKGSITPTILNLEGTVRNIYINEDIPKVVQELFRKGEELRNAGFKYVWVKNGNVFCREDESSKLYYSEVSVKSIN
ncbi:hypothetical protein HHI36_013057 [Cryptolaemus montrouzieri]|uniref:FP protein C-terminal domain-containing protein n=1 Tax=Cryptolaemus montrouzieri TaxID=559131 RepID=A0ABD2NGQ3_9CUCU